MNIHKTIKATNFCQNTTKYGTLKYRKIFNFPFSFPGSVLGVYQSYRTKAV